MDEKKSPEHGKKPNQKLKAYLVYEYLKKYSDEEHAVGATELIAYLETRGIDAERRSIYRDIDDINKLFYLLENEDAEIFEATDEVGRDAEDTEEEKELKDQEKSIVYDKSKKGFVVKRRLHFENDIRLLAECVYATKFVDEGTAELLIDTICSLVSEYQAERIRHNVFLADRVKTDNSSVYAHVDEINLALNHLENGIKRPLKITFRYQTYNINDLKQKAYRRGGATYTVSPYQLIINEGNYYLLGYDDKVKKMLTYRIDRMDDVKVINEPREGEEENKKIDLSSIFNMFGGEKITIQLRCINVLLDTMIERFGTKNAKYIKDDKDHFIVTAEVEISEQFYGWLCGFGRKAKLIAPPRAEEQFKEYLDKIRDLY